MVPGHADLDGIEALASVVPVGSEPSNPPNRSWIAGDDLIGGQKEDALGLGLGNDQAVEGVFVEWRQVLGGDGVLTGDGQLDIAVIDQAPPEQLRLDPEVGAGAGRYTHNR